MNEPAPVERIAVEDLMAEYVLAHERGQTPRIEDFEHRLTEPSSRTRLRGMHTAWSRMQGMFPVSIRNRSLLAGRYRLLREIGVGGFGKVWLAADERLEDRQVAVKVFNALASSRDVHRDLDREKSALARITHPGVVQILDVGDHDGNPYLVMQLVPGSNLTDLLQRLTHTTAKAPPPPTAVQRACNLTSAEHPLAVDSRDWWRFTARLMVQTLDALQAAHEGGLVHRDIKPSNIMLRPDGSVVLLDFGIARLLDPGAKTTTSGFTGTLPYMAPEQASGKGDGFEVASDIYQAGRVLYEMLTLQPAVPHDLTVGETLRRAKEGLIPTPRSLAPAVPRSLETICLRALEVDPRRRYASAREFREDLEDFLDGMPPRHVRTTALANFTRSLRRTSVRHRRVLVTLSVLVLGTLLGTVLRTPAQAGVLIQNNEVVRDGREFSTVLQTEDAVDVFGYVKTVSALGVELAHIPLITKSGDVVLKIQAGEQRVTMQLPPEIRLPEPGSSTHFVAYLGPAEAEAVNQMKEFQELLLKQVTNQGPNPKYATGIPIGVVADIALNFHSPTRGRNRPLTVDELLGKSWASAVVVEKP